MSRRAPGFVRAFAGRWRIAEMDRREDLDVLEPAHITFTGKDNGELVFVARSKPSSTCVTGHATAPPAPSSPGRALTTAARLAVADGQRWEPPAASSVTSSSIKATIQVLSPSASDFFNSLLVDPKEIPTPQALWCHHRCGYSLMDWPLGLP
jgi:hypothetical protein